MVFSTFFKYKPKNSLVKLILNINKRILLIFRPICLDRPVSYYLENLLNKVFKL